MDLTGPVIILLLIGLVAYVLMSQSPLPRRIRRIFNQQRQSTPAEAPLPTRRAAQWDADPDQVNEAREVERVTGVIRRGDAFTVTSSDPSHWGAQTFDIEGTITAVAEAETFDATGNFQFRYLTIDPTGGTPNTLIIEGDSPPSTVVYFGYAYTLQDEVDGTPVGQIVNRLIEERSRYREKGLPELATELPVYGTGAIIAARYEGKLAVLESEPGRGYLPASAAGAQGQPYTDMTVRLDNSGWIVRLVESGAYTFLLELEPLKLDDLTVHHRA